MRQNEVIISSSPQGITLVEAEFVLKTPPPITQDHKPQPDSGVVSVLQSPAQRDQTALSISSDLDSKATDVHDSSAKVNVGGVGVIITESLGAEKPQADLFKIQPAPADQESITQSYQADQESDGPPLPAPPTHQAPSLPQVSKKAEQPSSNVKSTGCFGGIVDKIFGPGSR